MATLVLLDGHSLAYRAFYALPTDLATKAGTVTNAVFGFTSMLVKLMSEEKPEYLAVAFDAPARTFRYDLDPEYKAGRKETPSLFASQMPLIREVLETMQVPQLCVEGVEADDVIATLATKAAAEGLDVIVVTGDRDAFQLIEDPHIKVLYNRRGVSDYVLYDEAGIAERYLGVTARQYPQYAALRGDNSDNLPGVPGIGEKTAASLIVKYGDLDSVFEHLDDLPPKQRQNLAEHKERVLLNRTMTFLRRDVELEFAPADLRQGAWDAEAVRTLFNQLEFRSLFARLPMAMGEGAPPPETDTLECVVANLGDAEEAARFLGEVAAGGRPRGSGGVPQRRYVLEPRFSAAPGRSDLLGLAVALDDSAATYLPAHVLETPVVVEALAALVGPGGPPLVAHRAKELTHGLRRLPGGEAIDVRTLDLDTAVGSYLLDPAETTYELPELARRYLQLEVAVGTAAAEGQLDLDGSSGVEESGRRAAAVHRLAVALEDGMAARELTELYRTIERPLVRVLARMEEAGVRIDVDFLRELSIELTKECGELEARVHAAAGERFNIGSVPQLRKILFEKLGLTPVKRTKTGPSTDADSLQKMAADHPIVEDLLRYREVEKLRNTYADALPPLVGADGRIHGIFNQTVATTGRISSDSPNLQNIPLRSPGGREFRRAFIPADGCELLVADYSQIELRLLAHLAHDPGLIEAFQRDADVHAATAAKVFGVPEEEVAPFQRRFAKVVNYGLAYGMEAYGLGQRMDIPTDQAKEILDAYFASFPNVRSFMETTVKDARSRGYTTTLMGRRRLLPELASDNFRIRQMGERMAQNAPVQGGAADIFKLAMVNLDAELEERAMRSRMVLTVHDEVVLEVPLEEHEAAVDAVRRVMESVVTLEVPLKVDIATGSTWADAKG
ncbi:MAG TPA: DNA polymerase I [Acidimicrobiia bacterium]|nr:DNA polymerase I [Acidimicrobiia bacterium]